VFRFSGNGFQLEDDKPAEFEVVEEQVEAIPNSE